MGFSLGSITAPLTSIATGGLVGGGGLLKSILGVDPMKPTPGPQNPYGKPDLAYLSDTSKLDYLKNPSLYNSLLNTSQYSNLLNKPSPVAPDTSKLASVPGNLKTFGSTYTAPGYGNSNALYSDLIKSTNAPSSVDQVYGQLNSDQLDQLLSGIDQDTKNTVGSLKSDYADRGLGGPGMLSDIEANGLAQAYASGDKTKAAARNTALQNELGLMQQEQQNNYAAKTAAAGAASGQDQQANQIAATGAEGDVSGYNNSLLDSLKAAIAEEDSAAGRTQQNQDLYANILNSNNSQYNNLLSQNNDLFANLLNARDLGAAGINSNNYNTAVGQQYQYTQPSLFNQLLGGFAKGGGAALGGALFG